MNTENEMGIKEFLHHLETNGDFSLFGKRVIKGLVSLEDKIFTHEIRLGSLVFGGPFAFNGATFKKQLYFGKSEFHGEVFFGSMDCKTKNSSFESDVSLEHATFYEMVFCCKSRFTGNLFCDYAQFMKDFSCNNASFKDFFMMNAEFHYNFHCHNATFVNFECGKGKGPKDFFFGTAKFHGTINAVDNHTLGMAIYHYKTGGVCFKVSDFKRPTTKYIQTQTSLNDKGDLPIM